MEAGAGWRAAATWPTESPPSLPFPPFIVGGPITVSWHGQSGVAGVEGRPLTSPAASEPLKLVPASLSPTHLPLGRGSVTFIVDNLRWPVVAVMTNARWGKDKVTTRAVSGEVSFSAPNAPQQLHTAPGANETTAVVQWVTKDTASPRLRWGSAPDALTAGDVAATT